MEDQAGNAPPALTAINELLPEESQIAVVRRVLAQWRHAPDDLRRFFERAVNSGARIDGFREPLKAPDELVKKNVLHRMHFSPEFLGIVLQIWMSSHQELQGVVSNHLSDAEMSMNGLDFSASRFSGTWDIESWKKHSRQVVESHSQFTEDDVALMLCCVSGNLPSSDVVPFDEPADTHRDILFPQWLEELQALPADAPQWQQATDFVASVTEIIQCKEKERHHVVRLRELLAELKQDFGRELAFFQCDADSLSLESLARRHQPSRPAPLEGIAELVRLTESLKRLLGHYKPVHDIASNIEEETVLAPKRSALQLQTLKCLYQIYQLFSPTNPTDDDPALSSKGPSAATSDAVTAPCVKQSELVERISKPADNPLPSAEAEVGPPQSANTIADEVSAQAALPKGNDESDGLHPSIDASQTGGYGGPPAELPIQSIGDFGLIESENRSLKQEIQTLQSDLKTSQDVVRIWRVAYETARKRFPRPDESLGDVEILTIEDVRTAVALAREKFADELLFKPNSKSEIDDNPYEKPGNVWTALKWLATTFYRSKMGQLSVPDLGVSILKACGWRYTGKQSSITMKQYKPWYTTHLEGKEYWLKKHVGTGSNKDARYTIRIAFDWDQDREVVLIGYIGQHQQTSAT